MHGSTDSGFSSAKPSLQTDEPQFLLPASDPQAGGTLEKGMPQELRTAVVVGVAATVQTAGSVAVIPACVPGPSWEPRWGATPRDREDSGIGLVQNSRGHLRMFSGWLSFRPCESPGPGGACGRRLSGRGLPGLPEADPGPRGGRQPRQAAWKKSLPQQRTFGPPMQDVPGY